MLEFEPLIERELTDLDEVLAERVRPVEASCELMALVEATFSPVARATDLEEALLTAAETPLILREPLVTKEPASRAVEVALTPEMAEPPLRP
jgi:hypothetical protein